MHGYGIIATEEEVHRMMGIGCSTIAGIQPGFYPGPDATRMVPLNGSGAERVTCYWVELMA